MSFGGGNKCVVCTKTVYMEEQVQFEKKFYHKLCFKCNICNEKIQDTSKAGSMEGKIFHRKCYETRMRETGGKVAEVMRRASTGGLAVPVHTSSAPALATTKSAASAVVAQADKPKEQPKAVGGAGGACRKFEPKTPGMPWAGTPCSNCEFKKKDHSADAQKTDVTRRHSTKDFSTTNWWMDKRNDPKKAVSATPGTTQGSLAFCMGQALNQTHKGKSTGLVKSEIVDKAETRDYHANKAANKDMAKAMAEMVTKAGTLDNKVGKYMAKKMDTSHVPKQKCATADCENGRSVKGYCATCYQKNNYEEA